MGDPFFRFPQTPHIAWLGNDGPRNDKMLSKSQVEKLLSSPVAVEEKLDGANIGFSVAPNGALRVQNRGQYLSSPFTGEFSGLTQWLGIHGDALRVALDAHLMAFGEWCAARHSLDYPALPDWWIWFDVYDRQADRFWSTTRRDALARKLSLAVAPRIAHGLQTLASLKTLVNEMSSHYRDGALEGVVVRREDAHWLIARGKLVHRGFIQAMGEHWRHRRLEWNHIDWAARAEIEAAR